MMKTVTTIFLLLMATAALGSENLTITDREMVADLVAIDKSISAISAGVMACIDSGKEHKLCMCENRALFNEFAVAMNRLLQTYPQLKREDLVHFKNPEGLLVNLSLETARRQAALEFHCNAP